MQYMTRELVDVVFLLIFLQRVIISKD